MTLNDRLLDSKMILINKKMYTLSEVLDFLHEKGIELPEPRSNTNFTQMSDYVCPLAKNCSIRRDVFQTFNLEMPLKDVNEENHIPQVHSPDDSEFDENISSSSDMYNEVQTIPDEGIEMTYSALDSENPLQEAVTSENPLQEAVTSGHPPPQDNRTVEIRKDFGSPEMVGTDLSVLLSDDSEEIENTTSRVVKETTGNITDEDLRFNLTPPTSLQSEKTTSQNEDQLRESRNRFCTKCGIAVDESWKFCVSCSATLR